MNICIIPARGGSKRLPRKNILPFKGEPIIARPIRAAKESGVFDDVIVSSDDQEILETADKYGAHPISRPAHLSNDIVNETGAYRAVIDPMNPRPDFFMGIYATAVFTTAEDIRTAYSMIQNSDYDVVMGVSAYDGPHPYQMMVQDGKYWRLKAPGLNEMTPYPRVCASNGSLYFFRTKSFWENSSYYQKNLGVIYTKSVDINTYEDFKRAEAMA